VRPTLSILRDLQGPLHQNFSLITPSHHYTDGSYIVIFRHMGISVLVVSLLLAIADMLDPGLESQKAVAKSGNG
jgi:hypothetical protein